MSIITGYGAMYFFLMFILSTYPSELLLKSYFFLGFFIDTIGIYALMAITIDDKRTKYFFVILFLILGIIGIYLTFKSTIGIELSLYFFKINIPQELWYYSQYAIFYPGIVIIFFLVVVGIENIESSMGKNILIFSVEAFTFGILLYFTIIDPIYSLIFYLLNFFGVLIWIIWEVVQRYR